MNDTTRYRTKTYNPQIVNEPTCFVIHVTRWVDNFTRKFGRKIKRVGGSYSECRGHTPTRYVRIPNTPNGREIADAVIAANVDSRSTGKPTTVVLRVAAPMPAWVTVHGGCTSIADALAKFHNALDRAADRGIIERKTEGEKMADAIEKIETGDAHENVGV